MPDYPIRKPHSPILQHQPQYRIPHVAAEKIVVSLEHGRIGDDERTLASDVLQESSFEPLEPLDSLVILGSLIKASGRRRNWEHEPRLLSWPADD